MCYKFLFYSFGIKLIVKFPTFKLLGNREYNQKFFKKDTKNKIIIYSNS